MRQLMSVMLKKQGHTVVEAEDGETALRQLEIHDTIALILLDVQMKPMGGLRFLETFQALERAIPVILVSGDTSSDLLARATEHGARGVLRKPIDAERLMKMITRELQA